MNLCKRCCPICNSDSFSSRHTITYPFESDRILPNQYFICSCNKCGMIFDNFAADAETFARYYAASNKYVQDFSAGAGGTTPLERLHFEKIYKFIEPYLPDFTASIADIGCGKGGLLDLFQQKGFTNLYAIDASSQCIDYISRHRPYSTLCVDLNKLETDWKFDLIICSHVFEHLFYPVKTLNKLKELLKPGGQIYLEVPNAAGYAQYLHKPYHYFDVEHINHFSLNDLKNLLKICNLELQSTGTYSFNLLDDKNYPVLQIIMQNSTNSSNANAIEYSLDGISHLKDYLNLSRQAEKLRNQTLTKIPHDRKIFLWGLGAYALSLLEQGLFDDFNLQGGIDINPELQNRTICGLKTYGPEILTQYPDADVFITSVLYDKEITKQLKCLGFKGHSYSF